MLICDNCGRQYQDEHELVHVFPNIPGLVERLDAGGTVPAGECVECGMLVYPVDHPPRLLILLEGGLVRAVLADKPGVKVVVLDQDLDGAADDEIVEVIGEIDTLRGTLESHGVNVAPVLVESAYRPA